MRASQFLIFVVGLAACTGHSAHAPDLDLLLQKLQDASNQAQQAQVQAEIDDAFPSLMSQPAEVLIPPLLRSLESADTHVRVTASALVAAKAYTSSEGARGVLAAASEIVPRLEDPNSEVRENLALAIALMQPRPPEFAEDTLRKLLGDPEPAVRQQVLAALSRLEEPDPETIQEVLQLAEPGGADAVSALKALGAFGAATPEVIEVMVSGLKATEIPTRVAAINGIRQIGPGAREVTPLLQRLADDPTEPITIQQNARAALAALNEQ